MLFQKKKKRDIRNFKCIFPQKNPFKKTSKTFYENQGRI